MYINRRGQRGNHSPALNSLIFFKIIKVHNQKNILVRFLSSCPSFPSLFVPSPLLSLHSPSPFLAMGYDGTL